MVVGIHTFIGGGFGSFHEYLNTGIRQVLNCAVPVFIACSGFLLANKSLSNRNEITGFYRKQIARVYIPCLIWSLPWFALHLLGGQSLTRGIINYVFCGFSVFYFVVLIIQYYLLLPVIQVIIRRVRGVILAFSMACSLVCVALVMHITAIRDIQVPLTLYAGPFPLWIVFFVLGVALANSKRDYKIVYIAVGIVIALILQLIEAKWLLSQSSHGIGFGIKPSSFLFSVLVILLLFSKTVESAFNDKITINNALAFLGRVSFVVYLSHTLVIVVISILLPLWSNLIWSIRFLIIAVLDVVMVGLLYRITPQKLKRIVGF